MRGTTAVYNLRDDPGESTDLRERHPEVMARLARIAQEQGGSKETVVARWTPRVVAPAVPLRR